VGRPGALTSAELEEVQGHVLEGKLAMGAAEDREDSEQGEQQRDHRAEIVAESGPTDQPAGGWILATDTPQFAESWSVRVQ
jgi:hypothetical protein